LAVVDTARYHDSTCARQLCANLKDGQIVVFDKAYVDYEHLFQLDQAGVFWVTRAKDNLDCRCVKRLIKKPEGRILRDDCIVLRGVKSRQKYPHRLRRVVALVEVDGREVVMCFLTNNFKWAASSITDLYQRRWAIEVFFKEIKQTLQLCDFFGHNKNAILWQVWTALLLYLLVRFLGFVHGWRHGFKRLFCLLRSCIWDGFDLGQLLKSCGTAPGPQ
jgi:IS4 transposase